MVRSSSVLAALVPSSIPFFKDPILILTSRLNPCSRILTFMQVWHAFHAVHRGGLREQNGCVRTGVLLRPIVRYLRVGFGALLKNLRGAPERWAGLVLRKLFLGFACESLMLASRNSFSGRAFCLRCRDHDGVFVSTALHLDTDQCTWI